MKQTEHAYPATLDWREGESESFVKAAFEHADFSFYVPAEKLADYRARAASMSKKEWKELFAEEGFVAVVAMVYGPKEMVLAHCKTCQAKYPNQYSSVAVALARFGSEALPVMLAQADRIDKYPSYAAGTVRELGPVDAAEVALPLSRLLKEKTLAVKKGAEAWFVRHPAAALAGLAPALKKVRERANVAAALGVLAAGGHGSAIRELLETAPAETKKALGKVVDAADRGAARKKGAPKSASHRHLGWVYYRAHHASPLVIGDLDVMKDWPGSSAGDDVALVELPKGKVVTFDLALQAPDVFLSADGKEVVLMAEEGKGRSLREVLGLRRALASCATIRVGPSL